MPARRFEISVAVTATITARAINGSRSAAGRRQARSGEPESQRPDPGKAVAPRETLAAMAVGWRRRDEHPRACAAAWLRTCHCGAVSNLVRFFEKPVKPQSDGNQSPFYRGRRAGKPLSSNRPLHVLEGRFSLGLGYKSIQHNWLVIGETACFGVDLPKLAGGARSGNLNRWGKI